MKTASASRAERILVWDAPVRVFHWLMVLSFAGAWATGDSERWRLAHISLGYTLAGLVVFRLLWGLIGTRHARFASFVRGPSAALRYLGSLVRGRPEHHVGHNPAGALAIVALLVLTLLAVASGWAADNGFDALEELHEGVVNGMLALVFVHVAAVLVSSWLHGENLVRSMIDGRKAGPPQDNIRGPWRSVAALLLAGVLGFWAWQWQAAPSAGDLAALQAAATARGGDRDDD